jgi:hypothetical protein
MTDDVLIVDGYNMIGAWPELREAAERDLEEARDRLIELLADYQGFTGIKVIVVFDAHQVPGLGARLKQRGLDVRYTKEKETADECIERLVGELMRRSRRIQVATSDYAEQRVIFGRGALRLSARELLNQVRESRRQIEQTIRHRQESRRNTFDHHLGSEWKAIFERWRRGGK